MCMTQFLESGCVTQQSKHEWQIKTVTTNGSFFLLLNSQIVKL